MTTKKKDKDKLAEAIFSYGVDYSEEENQFLRKRIMQLEDEMRKMKEPPLMMCEIFSVMDDEKAIIKIPNGNLFMSRISKDCENLLVGDWVVVDQKNLNIMDKVDLSSKSNMAEKFVIVEKPREKWENIGGLDEEINEIKEVIELPLLKPKLFKKIGIKPPKGILLNGPPGTGKTLMAKAVANSTHATFIEVVGSELVQKFIGEGAKLIKDIFALARKKAPSIIFIDEIDALACKRIEMGTSGEREVSRTFMQLLAELDGFKHLDNVKVIGATNRKDMLDDAILRPGRLDRHLFIDNPNAEGREEIFNIHIKDMSVSKINMKKLVKMTKRFSGAEIRAVVTEAGYFAIRNKRNRIKQDDFEKAINKIKQIEEEKEDLDSMYG